MLTKMLSRTWLLRIGVAAVLVVLAGAWAVGVTRGGDSSTTKDETTVSPPSDTPTDADADADVEPSDVAATIGTEPAETTTPSEDPLDEATPDTVDQVPGDGAVPVVNHNPAPTPKPSAQTPKPSSTPNPTPKPTPTPTQPAAGCTDLAEVVDCVLAPITSHP